ncbi:MAG: HAMP domain-containing histidine kinase [Sphingobacteriaceae bacterium]|nr:HAMP domain-containing histidine kinase [Sphingobacteriaceae bacterium]
MQGLWLFYAFENSKKQLADDTRKALEQGIQKLENEWHVNELKNEIPDLKHLDTLIHEKAGAAVNVIISKGKKIINWIGDVHEEDEVSVELKSDSFSTQAKTYIQETEVNVKGGIKKIRINKQSFNSSDLDSLVKNKAKKLESIFVKIAKEGAEDVDKLIKGLNFEHIQNVFTKELSEKGITLNPVIRIEKRGNTNIVLFSNSDARSVFIAEMELFPGNVLDHSLFIKLGYQSLIGAILKKMMGLTLVSLSLTLIIIFLIVYLIRHLLNQNRLMLLKTNFVNNMTHELKTPIATIGLALDAMNNKQVSKDEEKINFYKTIIKEENEKLQVHVEKILQQAVLEKNALVLNKEKLDIKQIVSKVLVTSQLAAEKKEIQIQLAVKDEHYYIQGDKHHLENAVNNVIDNAIKYSATKSKIEVRIFNRNDQLILEVEDFGIGISKEDQLHIFESFFRVTKGDLHDVKGFGLGLSYVKSIIQLHGGEVKLFSEVGKGTRIQFILLKA